MSPEQAAAAAGPEYPVREGDEIRIGDLVFTIRIGDDAEEPALGADRAKRCTAVG